MIDVSDVDTPPPTSPAGLLGSRRRRWIILGGVLALALLFVVGLLPRLRLWHSLDTRAEARRSAAPSVGTTHAERAAPIADIPLPGTTEPILVTGIYARTNGYLTARHVDIGDHVTAGSPLAEIAAPEVDEQLGQARAALAEAQATVAKLQADRALAHSTLQRYVAAGVGSVSKQQMDERSAAVTDTERAVDAAQATANANQANVDRLLELQGFERVTAPFEGIIIARHVDPGALVSAGSTQGTTELFRLAQVDTLRILVYVPQAYAPDIHVGQTADVTVRELPDRVFPGTVTRTAGAIDPSSRTLLTEVQVPNRDGALLAGSYVTVHFKVERANPPLLLTATALLIDAQGVRVGVVDPDSTLHYRRVAVGRDYGDRIEVLQGIDAADVVAVGVPGGLADGTKVDTTAPVTLTAAPAPSPSAGADAHAGHGDAR